MCARIPRHCSVATWSSCRLLLRLYAVVQNPLMSQDLAAMDFEHNLPPYQQHTRSVISIASMGAKPSSLTQASLVKWRCHKCSLCNIPMHPLTQLQAANVGPRRKSATNVSAADTNVANGNARLENYRPTSCGWERVHERSCEKGIELWKCCEERVVWRYKPLTMFYDITGNPTVLLRPRCYVRVHVSTDVGKAANERRSRTPSSVFRSS
jgi:hypothetical protein